MKQNNHFPQLFFSLWASIVLMLAMMFSMFGVQPVLARDSSQATAAAWYVAANGDDANDCQTPVTPCATINGALGKAAAGDTIEVALGTYSASSGTEVVLIARDITLSGGWDETFNTQNGRSSIDGQKLRRGITLNSAISATVDHFSIQNGFNSTQGGGIRSSGSLILNNSEVSANVSGYRGGGIDNSNGSVTLNNSTVSNNTLVDGSSGSGIYAAGTLTLNNSTINGNFGGDGIYIYNGTLNLNNSTISANQSYGFNNAGGSITLQNTIVAGNGTVGDCLSNGGTVASHGYNLIGKGDGCGFNSITGDKVGTLAQPIDARLGALSENGGATLTQALHTDSPALDAGNPATPGSGGAACLATDQRGVVRPSGSACDIGAYEGSISFVKSIARANANPTTAPNVDFFVTFSEPVTGVDPNDFAVTTARPAGASVTAATGSDTTYTVSVNTGMGADSLRLDIVDDDSILDMSGIPLGGPGAGNGNFTAGEAYIIPTYWYVTTSGSDNNDCLTTGTACASINGAISKTKAEDIIKVAIGTYSASSGTEVVLINKNLTLSGGWDEAFSAQNGKSIIDGGKVRRGITINSTVTVIADHLRIQNGFHSTQGGGISNSGSLTLTDSIVSNNIGSVHGGGIYNSGTLTINNTAITENTAATIGYSGDGGGGIDSYGNATLNNSTVSNNTLINNYFTGSGIDVFYGTLILNNSTVSGNTGGNGIGIDIVGATVIFNNSTISGNQKYGFVNLAGKISLQNTIVAGNGASSDCYNNTSGSNGTVTSHGYNLIGKSDGCSFIASLGDKVGTIARPIDARLGSLSDHGGATLTQPLYSDSPALEAGNPAAPGSGGAACIAMDQRGIARPVGSVCDIGAYEGSVTGVKSIKRASPNSTSAPSVNFIVTFSDAVTGVDPGDFALITTGQTGATISAISGSNTTYTVSVNTVPGIQTLRLDVVDDDSILNTLGDSIGGPGAGNGNFTTGEVYTLSSIWYVTTNGNDANSCLTSASACASINGTIGKATTGDTIKVALGTYTASSGAEVVLINKGITLSGGWNAVFSAQSGRSIIDGQKARRGLAVYSTGTITAVVDHFSIQNGSCSEWGMGGGAGIFNSENLTLSNSIVSNNISASTGGGIFNFNGTLTINNTTITRNSSGTINNTIGRGGGIHAEGGSVTLNNSTVNNNSIIGFGDGSGIYIDHSGPLTLNNSTVSGNIGNGIGTFNNGDGIYNDNSTVNLNNSTISGNQNYGYRAISGRLILQNTIIAGNGPNSDCFSYALVTSYGYNLIGKGTGCHFIGSIGDKVGTSAQPIDARLGALQNNGGATQTQALLSDSPALNAGNPAVPGSADRACLATDQRGVARPLGKACDIGAYEGYAFFVKSITRASANPTSTGSVSYIVTFPKAVTGVNTFAPFSDFALTTSGLSGAEITSVSGSGNIYKVIVKTGIGGGNLRLDVVDDDSIIDSSGNPLGGALAGNGNFKTGDVYTVIGIPVVSAITLASPNPVTTANVNFIVDFSEAVSGVDKTDFSLTKTGLITGTIGSVSGSGATYIVSVAVNTDPGNGTLRLDIVDNDSIKGTTGKLLGGTGLGNGNFNTGKTYTILTIPIPQMPTSFSSDNTPTYQWSKIPGATQYQYQLWQGTAPVYTKLVASSACGAASCTNTPTNTLSLGVYKWRVQAKVNGVWKQYSAYKPFSVTLAKAGFWKDDLRFYVTPASASVENFSIDIHVSGDINDIDGKPSLWKAIWVNASQSSSAASSAEEPTVIKVAPVPGANLPTFTVDPIKP